MLERINDPAHASFFQYVRLEKASDLPPADERVVDVAILDMNHSWPNIGHHSLVHAVLEAAQESRDVLLQAGITVRVISFDIRQRLLVPEPGRFALYVATGGPGYIDPRMNDGIDEYSQGIAEDPSWERPLFALFDDILRDEHAALIAVCHSFGLLCRWSGIATPALRGPEKGGKSSGMPTNVLSDPAVHHPWFAQFAGVLDDHRHFRVIDNRLFDLIANRDVLEAAGAHPISFELSSGGDSAHDALTMVELARERDGSMPRILAVNHHPEIIDREHLTTVLDEKFASGEVSRQWYEERINTLRNEFANDGERQSQLTSWFTLIGPLRYHVRRLINESVSRPAEKSATPLEAVAHA